MSKPRVYIVPIEWQISGEKTNADNSVECVEKSAADKLADRVELHTNADITLSALKQMLRQALREYRGEK